MASPSDLPVLIECRRCPRLVAWRELVAREKRKSFQDETYWGRPVPDFGDPTATRLIVGLAPAAHGANRTGRMFTGDRSGDWLYRALFKAGVADQATSVSADDGLQLTGVLITASVHCAPPDNKPTPDEFRNCAAYLEPVLRGRQWESILCLGSIAWTNVLAHFGVKPRPPFGHGAVYAFEHLAGAASPPSRTKVVGCYHPSQQNTFTGKLTEQMLDSAVAEWLT